MVKDDKSIFHDNIYENLYQYMHCAKFKNDPTKKVGVDYTNIVSKRQTDGQTG